MRFGPCRRVLLYRTFAPHRTGFQSNLDHLPRSTNDLGKQSDTVALGAVTSPLSRLELREVPFCIGVFDLYFVFGIPQYRTEPIVQLKSTEPSHTAESNGQPRLKPPEIVSNYAIDSNLKIPNPKVIFVVDDVLTAGAHFRASKDFLSPSFPGVPVTGLFVARRVPGTTEIID